MSCHKRWHAAAALLAPCCVCTLSFRNRSHPWRRASRRSIAWTQPGAAADCDPAYSYSVAVPPGHTMSGMMAVSLTLPGALVASWATNNGAANFGVLLR